MCIIFGNVPHDIQSPDVYESAFSPWPVLKKSPNRNCKYIESAPKYRDGMESGDKRIVLTLLFSRLADTFIQRDLQ